MTDLSILIDSDVLVWVTRGNVLAAERVNAISLRRISAVTYIELAQGCRDKAELARLKAGLAAMSTEILPITPKISSVATELIDGLALSSGLRLADALIAATAIERGMTLLTGNLKHFTPIAQLRIERFVV